MELAARQVWQAQRPERRRELTLPWQLTFLRDHLSLQQSLSPSSRFRPQCWVEHCVGKREQVPIRYPVCAVEHFYAACLIRSLGRFLSNQAARRAKFVFQVEPIAPEIRKHNGSLVAVIGWIISILELLTIGESRLIAATLPFSSNCVAEFPLFRLETNASQGKSNPEPLLNF